MDGMTDPLPNLTPGERARKTHELKTWPEYFDAILQRRKSFEIRKNDRDYEVNDILWLRDWNPSEKEYSGRELFVRVTYITGWDQKDGNVVMGIEHFIPSPVDPDNNPTEGERQKVYDHFKFIAAGAAMLGETSRPMTKEEAKWANEALMAEFNEAPADTGWRMLEVCPICGVSLYAPDGVIPDHWPEKSHKTGAQKCTGSGTKRLPSPQPVVSAETPTPRTDANLRPVSIYQFPDDLVIGADFARTIELELIASQRALLSAEGERDAAIAALAPTEKVLESAYSYLQTCQCDCTISGDGGGIDACGRCVVASEVDSALSGFDRLDAALAELARMKAKQP